MIKYFHDDVELTNIRGMDTAKFASAYPGIKGRKYDGYSRMVGRVVGTEPVWAQGQGWQESLLPVDRVVTYKDRPSRHECDARCMNASGRTMTCECSCGGKNHGRSFAATPAF